MIPSTTVGDIFITIIGYINHVFVPLLFAVAFIVFLYGVFKYFILGGDEAENHKTGATYVMYGIIGFAIMVSVWGLVNIAVNIFGLDLVGPPSYPTLTPY
jgi:hypothetical protein